MALVLVSTVGSASANTWAVLLDADTLADELWPVPSAWLAAVDDARARCLVKATRIMETLAYPGAPADSTQALSWPRAGVYKPNGAGAVFLLTEIPPQVIRAQSLLAIWLLDQTKDPGLASDAGLSSISFGGELSMSFESGATGKTPLERFLWQRVFPELGELAYVPQPRMVRG